MKQRHSGQPPFTFIYRDDLHTLPQAVLEAEVTLHGGFAADKREGYGQLYYGMPGHGILRIDADLKSQELIKLSEGLKPVNFHSTKLASIDGQQRLILSANGDEMVAVVSLEGEVDFILPRPEFEAYQAQEVAFNPTDTVLVGNHLYVADGYGANYISAADVTTRRWTTIFGGKTDDPTDNGHFATAHGINVDPSGSHLTIADRPSSRIQAHHFDGSFLASHKLPQGSWPCGIDFLEHQGRSLAVVGSLQDPVEGRAAPIYILDATNYEVLSVIRPKEELGIDLVQHLHNVVWHVDDDQLYLICQAWNPGYYFVLQQQVP